MRNKICKIEHLLFFLLCVMSIFVYSYSMIDKYIMPKWYLTISIILFWILISCIKKFFSTSIKLDLSICGYIIISVCSVQALYGIFQWNKFFSTTGVYNIVGSFDNPVGFSSCLCFGLPFVALCLRLTKDKLVITILYLLSLIIIYAIIISESRSAIISVIVIICLWSSQYVRITYKYKVFIFICILLLFLIGAYFFRKDSADGRLLIWKCSWEMVKDSPIWGHGINAFRNSYMDYQANYFEENPNSPYIMLADNVVYPFNEYLTVLICFGFVGLFMLFLGGGFLFFYYRRNPKYENFVALISLIAIGIFSMFSYPFTYPFSWVILCFDIYIILNGVFYFKLSSKIYILFLILSLGVSYKLYQYISFDIKWNKMEYSSISRKKLDDYEQLNSILGLNPYFLYNYSLELYDKKYFKKSLEKALLCRKYLSNFDLELLLGDIYRMQKQYEKAEWHYKRALFMCPCRFIPLYQLFELYKEKGDLINSFKVAQLIINKSVKIDSMLIIQMKYKMKQVINSYYKRELSEK